MAECWRGGGAVRAVDSWRFCCWKLPRRCKRCGVLIKGGGMGGGRCSDEEASIHQPTAAERLTHPGRGPRRARRGRWLPEEDRKCPSPERRHLHHCWSECQSSAMWTIQKAMANARTALHSPPCSCRSEGYLLSVKICFFERQEQFGCEHLQMSAPKRPQSGRGIKTFPTGRLRARRRLETCRRRDFSLRRPHP